jgi:protein-disulfide isomerase
MRSKIIKNPLRNNYIILLVIVAILATVFFVNYEDINKKSENSSNPEIEKIIADWISNNPEAIIESIQNMQRKAAEEQIKNAQKNISLKKKELYEDKDSPKNYAENYDVTIVEFFDYSCGYCKRAAATIEKLTKEDNKIRIIHKHFPILGQSSNEMAQVALAVNIAQPKYYLKFHQELMNSQERGKKAALDAAKKAGANIAKIEAVLEDKKNDIQSMISKNIQLGSSIGVSGTPGFVIGEELIPGAVDIESFREKIKNLRK